MSKNNGNPIKSISKSKKLDENIILSKTTKNRRPKTVIQNNEPSGNQLLKNDVHNQILKSKIPKINNRKGNKKDKAVPNTAKDYNMNKATCSFQEQNISVALCKSKEKKKKNLKAMTILPVTIQENANITPQNNSSKMDQNTHKSDFQRSNSLNREVFDSDISSSNLSIDGELKRKPSKSSQDEKFSHLLQSTKKLKKGVDVSENFTLPDDNSKERKMLTSNMCRVVFPPGAPSYKGLLMRVLKKSEIVLNPRSLFLKFPTEEEARTCADEISNIKIGGEYVGVKHYKRRGEKVFDPLKRVFHNPSDRDIKPGIIKCFYGADSIEAKFENHEHRRQIKQSIFILTFASKLDAEEASEKKMNYNGKVIKLSPFFFYQNESDVTSESSCQGMKSKGISIKDDDDFETDNDEAESSDDLMEDDEDE